jgi:hypothetical protein
VILFPHTAADQANTHALNGTAGKITANDTGLPSGGSAYRVEFWAKPVTAFRDYDFAYLWGTQGTLNAVSGAFIFTGSWYFGSWGPSVAGPPAILNAWQRVTVSHNGSGYFGIDVNGTTYNGSAASNIVLGGQGLEVGGGTVSPIPTNSNLYIANLKIWSNAAGDGLPVRRYRLNNSSAEYSGGTSLSAGTFVADRP